jgi:hypothetical protein
MKKLIFVFTGLMAFSLINAQSLEDILKKYSVAHKIDQLSNLKTIKTTSKMSVMGMEMQVERWMKNPNKTKTVTNMNGQESFQVFDGEKGYMVNNMGGTHSVIEMTPDQVKEMLRENMFENYWMNYYKDGLLALEGEEIVNKSPAFKIKATLKDGFTYLFLEKNTYLIVKQSITGNQEGMISESFPSEYAVTNGVFLPMKIKGSFFGTEAIITVTNVEVNIPMDDSIFKPN